MSIFKKFLKDAFEKPALEMYEKLLTELLARLQEIGVNGTAHLSGSMMESMSGSLVGRVAGYVTIEGRNIDRVQVETEHGTDPDDMHYARYHYHYIVLASVDGLEKRLEANVKPVRKGFLSRDVVDFQWEKGDLAQRLNGDAELRTLMLQEGLNQLPRIEVRTHGKPRKISMIGKPPQGFLDAQAAFKPCVRITNTRAKLPTRAAFELYDRIAYHVSSITKSETMGGESE